MAKINWSESAIRNLEDIADYIALSNPLAASKLVKEIFLKVDRLEQFPASGRIPPEIADLEYMEVVVPPCRVFYRQEKDNVFILFVMRHERDLHKFLLKGEG